MYGKNMNPITIKIKRIHTNFFLFSISLNMGIIKHIKAELCTVKAIVTATKYLIYCLLSIYLKAKKIMATAIYCLTVLNDVKYMKDKYIKNAKIITPELFFGCIEKLCVFGLHKTDSNR